MTQPATTTISVRGDAQRSVAPDQAQLYTSVRSTAASKAEATAATRRSAGELADRLRQLGGQPLTVDTLRAPLTWSVQSINTQEEYADKGVQGHGPTGRHICELTMPIM